MVSHKYSNGQTVQARKNPWAALVGAYEIVCRLPVSGGDNQYWVKSLENGDHRVVRESDLAVEFPDEGALACAAAVRRPGRVPGDLSK
jgi:hypothetical protein